MQDPIMFSLVREDSSTKLRLQPRRISQTRFYDNRYPIENGTAAHMLITNVFQC
jgi:hypothetical protein